MPCRGIGEHGSVLCDHGIHEPQIACHTPQVVKEPAGHEHDDHSRSSHLRDGGTHVRIKRTVDRDGTVVVEREHAELHIDILLAADAATSVSAPCAPSEKSVTHVLVVAWYIRVSLQAVVRLT